MPAIWNVGGHRVRDQAIEKNILDSSVAKCKVATHWIEEVRADVMRLYQQPSYTVHTEDLAEFQVKSRPILQTATESGSVIRTVDQSHSADHLADVQK